MSRPIFLFIVLVIAACGWLKFHVPKSTDISQEIHQFKAQTGPFSDALAPTDTPPVGILVPTAATIPSGFKEVWKKNTEFGYTVQYASGIQRLTIDSWPGFKAGGSNLPNWFIDGSAPGLENLLEGSQDFEVNGIHGEIQTMASRMGNKNVIYDLVWNNRGHKLRIIFGPVSQSAAMRQYVIGLISTMAPQQAADAGVPN